MRFFVSCIKVAQTPRAQERLKVVTLYCPRNLKHKTAIISAAVHYELMTFVSAVFCIMFRRQSNPKLSLGSLWKLMIVRLFVEVDDR